MKKQNKNPISVLIEITTAIINLPITLVGLFFGLIGTLVTLLISLIFISAIGLGVIVILLMLL